MSGMGGRDGAGEEPRGVPPRISIPPQRPPAEDTPHWADRTAAPPPGPGPSGPPGSTPHENTAHATMPNDPEAVAPPAAPTHKVLKSLLGAWALAACSGEETAAVEEHLTDCASCADEAVRLRDAVALLHPQDNLDLDPKLRSRVLTACLGRRPARIPVPGWAAPYDAETARLDALLRDIGEAEWRAPVRLKWFDGQRAVGRDSTVAAVIGHLTAVDSLLSAAFGLPDPLGPGAPAAPTDRTEAFWAMDRARPAGRAPGAVRSAWRDQAHALIRSVSFTGDEEPGPAVSYGAFELPLRDSFVERAFECWVHAGDIAEAVDYPYAPPAAGHLHHMIGLAVRLLPDAIAGRRRAGLAPPPRALVAAGSPGRTLHLEVEGSGGGHWYVPLDSPGALASPEGEVAHVALDGVEFCRLAAGHVPPQEAAAGQKGDREAIRDALFATASLSRL
ncbi:maleylpyruvate isomerase family mycothiol-dependent enzyme [Streptomyces sp. NPDC046215]|uniref:Zf-HC2 domain-containing protein n=1 Tax=Streptomyces stramineus TaxID=173861 RepID=A0ABN1AVX8_9ACTN